MPHDPIEQGQAQSDRLFELFQLRQQAEEQRLQDTRDFQFRILQEQGRQAEAVARTQGEQQRAGQATAGAVQATSALRPREPSGAVLGTGPAGFFNQPTRGRGFGLDADLKAPS